MAPEIRPAHRLPTRAGRAGRTAVPVRVRVVGTPSGADLDKLTGSVARAVGRQLRAAGAAAVERTSLGETRDVPPEDRIRIRLRAVEHDLSTGIGVRSPAAIAELEAERVRLLTELTTVLAGRLEDVRAQRKTGIGVRSPEALTQLEADERRASGELAAARLLAQQAAGLRPPPETLAIDWFEGHQGRGLSAEGPVGQRYYPGATPLPRAYPGIDLIEGGTRTPLTGIIRVGSKQLPLTPDSVRIEGGTLVQVKTVDNHPGAYARPGALRNQLIQKGIDLLAATESGTGRSQDVGGSAFRVEHTGPAERRILHIELRSEPTADHLAELEAVREYGSAKGIEVVYRWPKAPSLAVPGTTGVALGVAGTIGRELRREEQLERRGYAPVGAAAFAEEPWYVQLGSLFRLDWFESSVRAPGPVDIPVWRQHVRRTADAKKPGDTLRFLWQTPDRSRPIPSTRDIEVTYRKTPEGRWRVETIDDAPAGFTPPDLNAIVDPAVGDGTVAAMLSSEGA
ncbi:hypothetical protein NDR87_03230 [Nocardia sp. CDC159]|uniref:Uncharacterized protein n=1 Tax=Nocardia pulmonis TaxID=2951408 RepID=A0A9X2E5I5_9NOCA|nr:MULTISPECIES: hypothetical protein [Nocardia]MCM6771973.1 hypothetical protein [Nocardia pulmonis]MCM6785369.1 hypothetical protein [Nocardia sp. CDC159]